MATSGYPGSEIPSWTRYWRNIVLMVTAVAEQIDRSGEQRGDCGDRRVQLLFGGRPTQLHSTFVLRARWSCSDRILHRLTSRTLVFASVLILLYIEPSAAGGPKEPVTPTTDKSRRIASLIHSGYHESNPPSENGFKLPLA